MKNYIDFENDIFKVIEQKKENNRNLVLVICKKCNNKKWLRSDYLTNKKVRSCGCLASSTQFKETNYTNTCFNNIKFLEKTNKKSGTSYIYKCRCHCGKIFYSAPNVIINKNVKSCGCLRDTTNNIKKARDSIKKYYKENTSLLTLNSKLLSSNTSGYKGVSWDRSRKKWVAQITFKGKKYRLGRYNNIEDAIKARIEAEEKYFKPILDKYKEQK